ncbi:hypothetical protein ACFLSQ_08750 [Bacteroidota bacterium]
MTKRNILLLLMTFFFALISTTQSMNAQLDRVKFSVGLSTIQILGNNLATKPFEHEEAGIYMFGGSFDQSQSGLKLEALFALDNEEIFEIPVGFEYYFYKGREKEQMQGLSDRKFRHDVNIMTFVLGFNYSFFKFNPLNSVAKFYVGLDTRSSIIFQGRFEQITNDVEQNIFETLTYDTKEDAFRLGGVLKLGLNGRLYEPLYVDFSAGIGIMNLIGKDDNRGELLTPFKHTVRYNEDEENLVYNYHLTMMLQVKL